MYFQAAVSDDGIAPARLIDEPNAVVARLQNSEGAALQAVMRYRAETAPDGTTAWAYDEPRFIELPALHVVADVSLVSLSGERPGGYLWSSEPLRVVSADGAVGVTTNGQGNATPTSPFLLKGTTLRFSRRTASTHVFACSSDTPHAARAGTHLR